MKAFTYHCTFCGTAFAMDYEGYICANCGENIDVVPDFRDIDALQIRSSDDRSIWRYAPLLPVDRPDGPVSALHAVGWTPVYETRRLAEKAGLRKLYVKDEGRNPTASFKDRASAVVVARAMALGVETIITASSGNAGAALAGMAAAAGMDAVILVPKRAPQAKVAQLRVFDANVMLVDGTYDDAFDLTLEASRHFGWYCRNTGYNAFTLEGKKTAAFEIWEQMPADYFSGQHRLHIFVSVGDGNIISGVHKGFRELKSLGWIAQMPRIFGVQAQGSAAIADAYDAGIEEIHAVDAQTIADSISVGLPRDGLRALRAATQTGGAYIRISDEAILDAIRELGQEGIFAEPAGAAAYAGMLEAVRSGKIVSDAPVLVLNTGNGLKDITAAIEAVGQAPIIAPDLESMKAVLNHA